MKRHLCQMLSWSKSVYGRSSGCLYQATLPATNQGTGCERFQVERIKPLTHFLGIERCFRTTSLLLSKDFEQLSESSSTKERKEKKITTKVRASDNIDLPTKLLLCKVYGEQFPNKKDLKSHSLVHVGKVPFKSQVCGEGRETFNHINVTIDIATNTHQCDSCGKGFQSPDDLKEHKCDSRRKNFQTPKYLKRYVCETCGKGFQTPEDLRRHMCTHTGERPFQCEVCGKGFVTADNLKRHRYTHGGEKPHECTECGKRFVTPQDLERHKRYHTEETPFTCEVCGKKFKLFSQLHIHKTVHSDKKPFVCDICGKKYKYRSTLKTHKKRIHGKDTFIVEV